MGEVAGSLPSGKFDVAFSAYVLNVVPEHIERQILNQVSGKASKQYHATRNLDIFDTVKKALLRGDPLVSSFFLKEFASPEEAQALENGTLSDETILEFCHYGVQISRGFQRIPVLEEKGYSLIKRNRGWKLYG
jgi:hypothetical protein